LLGCGKVVHEDAVDLERGERCGEWITLADGTAAGGLGLSGLVFRVDPERGGEELWAIADQYGRASGQGSALYRIDPRGARVMESPVSIAVARELDTPYRAYLEQAPDYECLTRLLQGDGAASDHETFVAVIEDDRLGQLGDLPPAVVSISVDLCGRLPRAEVTAVTPIRLPDSPAPSDRSVQCEGCAADDAGFLYLALEGDPPASLPEIHRLALDSLGSSGPLQLESFGARFCDLVEPADLADLTLNDVAFLPRRDPGGPRVLLALARNQERVYLLDLDRLALVARWDLGLVGPDGERVEWLSPEGIAADSSGRVWIVNDPVGRAGNDWKYRPRSGDDMAPNYTSLTPMLHALLYDPTDLGLRR
jgi:hypothetical protein